MTFGPYIDFCSGSSLREYYCDTTTGNYSSELYVCPNGCQDSVCQQAPAVPTASINPLTPITPTVYSIAVASPNGGEIWQAGTTHDITWTASGVTNVYITLATYNSSGSRVGLYSVAPGVPASLGKYTWTIPSYYSLISSYTARSKIIISSTASATSATVSDQSDNYFSIVVPTAYEANATDPLAAVSQALQDILEQIRLLLAK